MTHQANLFWLFVNAFAFGSATIVFVKLLEKAMPL